MALLLCLLGGLTGLYGKGKTDAAETEIKNKDWVLCVTAFDVSSLPPARRLVGEVLARNLLDSLKLVEFRMRMAAEYDYYEQYAWTQGRLEAAKRLAAKRNERDQLIFKGEADWKYRNSLKTVEGDIKKLEEEFAKAQGAIPLIAREPVFKFSEANNNGTFPAPPREGGEYRFCTGQRADAFLAGTVSEFHGRLYISVRMYTVYTRSFQYDDAVIFSSEDAVSALDELAGRLLAAAAGTEPAYIAIHAQPEEAVVIINGAFAGRGEAALRENPPGKAAVEVFAEGYETVSLPAELFPGELAELYINLRPLSRQALTVDVPGKPGTLVYRGALYLGDTPAALTMPALGYEYIHVETVDGETGAVVVQGTGRREASPVFELRTKMPPGPDEKPVSKARRAFYGAYGRFWIALPVAFILGGVYNTYLEANNYNVAKGISNEELYNDALKYYYISTGATVVAGIALTETFYRIFRYVYTSGQNNNPPIVK